MLPAELLHYLNRRSCSLLVKGTAGSGKTTLALTLLRALARNVNFLYLSTRESPTQLYADYPWLSESFSGQGQAKSAGKVHPGFVDARLDEPGPLFERITSELMDVRTPLIVIDTWNTMEDYVNFEDLQVNVKVLRSWIERVGGKLILVGEDPNDSTLDALVDGIVVLRQNELEGRRVREMTLVKLSGTEIRHPVHNFTLKDGTFTAFPHTKVDDLLEAAGSDMETGRFRQAKSGDYVSTGYAELDSALGGGFSRGSLVKVEMSQGVDPRMVLLFLRPMMDRLVKKGGGAKVVPWEGASKRFVSRLMVAVSAPGRKKVKFLWGDANEITDSKASTGSAARPLSSPKTGASERELAIVFVDPDRPDNVRRSLQRLSWSRKTLTLLVGTPERIPAELTRNAEAKLKLFSINGTLFAAADSPFTRLFALVKRGSGKLGYIGLEQVV